MGPLEERLPRDVALGDLERREPVGLGEVERGDAVVVGLTGRVVESDDGDETGERLSADGVLLEEFHRGVERGGIGPGELVEQEHVPVGGAVGQELVEDQDLEAPVSGVGVTHRYGHAEVTLAADGEGLVDDA